ncbi:lactosylceramide 4-alpha-galactosyltransferase-like [Palaemon carinicauda]|uniref:lactosylceramide 4-alpha-galactosyltransferase-like n=1 Tax=Palaemon carinicauda TaxID=392227 RepID=UPI0035B5E7E6
MRRNLRHKGTVVVTSVLALMMLRMFFNLFLISRCPECNSLEEDETDEQIWWRKFICKNHQHPLLKPHKLPVLFRDIIPSSQKYNIYLVESSCVRRPAYRSFCSVESYAKMNPKADVWYVMITEKCDNPDGLLTTLERKYPNLHLVSTDFELMFKGLPTLELFTSRRWMKSHWLEIHLSDMMRLALLGQTGGLFSDTDTVCLKDVTHLKNFVGLGEKGFINNAIFHFDRDNLVLQQNLKKQNEYFDVIDRGANGLMVLTNVIRDTCNINLNETDVKHIRNGEKCQGIKFMTKESFYPIPLKNWRDLFTASVGERLLKNISSSYVIHTWSGMTSLSSIGIGSGSLYDVMAASCCPVTREIAKLTDGKIRYSGEALPGRAWHRAVGRG